MRVSEHIELSPEWKETMEYKVKPLELCYVDEVCRMEEEAFSMPWHKESFIEMINHPDACYLVTVEVGPEGERVVFLSHHTKGNDKASYNFLLIYTGIITILQAVFFYLQLPLKAKRHLKQCIKRRRR